MNFDLVVLGNLIVDDIVYDDGTTRMAQPGGAILYMGATAHLWDLRLGLVSIVGSDYPREMLRALEEHGVDLAGVRRSNDPGLRTWLLYEGHIRRVVHRLDGPTHAQWSPTAKNIPADWHPQAIHLAPMPLDLQRELATGLSEQLGGEVLLSLDPFELLTRESLDRWHRLLALIDLFFVSQDELASGETPLDPERVLRHLMTGQLETVFYKQGEEGGQVLRATKTPRLAWPGRAASVVDTTGAGDAFACGVLAGLIRDQPLARALQWGVVSASFAIEEQGVEALLQATPDDAQQRLASWFGP